MLRSMTGCGIAEGVYQGISVRAEVRSLNSRYLDYSSRLPSVLLFLDQDMKTLVQKFCVRGKVSLFVSMNNKTGIPSVSIDEKRVSFYVNALKKVQRHHKLTGAIEIADVLSFPDIFVSDQQNTVSDRLKTVVMGLVEKALESLGKEKRKEGAFLVKDIQQRIEVILTALEKVKKAVHDEPARVREKILQRVQALDDTIKVHPERLEQEVLFWIDKSDITEETVRLKSHCVAFKDALLSKGEAGKRLEFITQEMNREVNTIGSKSQSGAISPLVIAMKLEVEKIREQIQNIE